MRSPLRGGSIVPYTTDTTTGAQTMTQQINPHGEAQFSPDRYRFAGFFERPRKAEIL